MTVLTRARLKEIAGLARKRNRDAVQQYVAEGFRSVESAVGGGAPVLEVLVTEEAERDDRCAAILAQVRVPIYRISSDDMARAANTQAAQGLLAVVSEQHVNPLSLSGSIVALDGVQDPGNVGAIIRSAAWFGASGIIVGAGSADPFGPKAVRASMGGLWDVEIALAPDLASVLFEHRQRGLPIFGADLQGTSITTWSPAGAGMLVLGSEARGMCPDVRQWVEQLIRIEGGTDRKGVESLNVTVAAGILLHHWLA